MNIAIVGCGYVSEFYGKNLSNYPELKLVGAYDTNAENLRTFRLHWPSRAYASLEELLDDDAVEMVLNLTNPRSHYEVSRRCIEAGKHVYSEKPLALDSASAARLVALAGERQVYLGAAPCSVLGETAQTVWKALKDGAVGRVRLVYANFDDGMIAPQLEPWRWRNGVGVPWPAKDEFEVGCTYEHAGYVLTWLAAFFGPARAVTAFASCQIPDKGVPVDAMAPDFSVGCIEYDGGVVARVTCSVVAARDKSLTIFGDGGVLSTGNVRNDVSPVYVRRTPFGGRARSVERRVDGWRRRLESRLNTIIWSGKEWRLQRKYPFARKPAGGLVSWGKPVDFCRGPAEMAAAIRERRPCRLSAELGLHITELLEALQFPERYGWRRKIESSFAPIEPLDWDA